MASQSDKERGQWSAKGVESRGSGGKQHGMKLDLAIWNPITRREEKSPQYGIELNVNHQI